MKRMIDFVEGMTGEKYEMATTKLKFIIGDKKLCGTQFGANIMEGSERNLATMIPLAKAMGFPVYYYNLISGVKNDVTAAMVLSFLKETGAKLGIFLPIWQTVAPDYVDWLVKTFGAYIDFIQLDQESISNPANMTNTQYITKSKTAMVRYPYYDYSWDCGLLTRPNDRAQVARNTEIAKQAVPPYEGRQYAQLVDILTGAKFGADQAANMELIKNLIAVLLPQYFIDDFRKYTPNLKKINILQWFNENAGENFLSGAVSNYAIGEFIRFILTNTEGFARVFWMQIAGLMSRGVASPEYNSIKRFMAATKSKYIVPLEIKMDGVTGIGQTDGVSSFSAILNNQTAKEYIVTSSEIKVYGKAVVGIFFRDTGWARDLNSETQNEVVADLQFTIRPYSCSLISFKTT